MLVLAPVVGLMLLLGVVLLGLVLLGLVLLGLVLLGLVLLLGAAPLLDAPLFVVPIAGIAPLDGATSVDVGVEPVACAAASAGGVVAGPALGCGVGETCAPLLGVPVGLTVDVAFVESETAPLDVVVVAFFDVSLGDVVCCAAAGRANAASITAASAYR